MKKYRLMVTDYCTPEVEIYKYDSSCKDWEKAAQEYLDFIFHNVPYGIVSVLKQKIQDM